MRISFIELTLPVNQRLNPYSSSSIIYIKQVFPEADTVELLKSYRSTIEISSLSRCGKIHFHYDSLQICFNAKRATFHRASGAGFRRRLLQVTGRLGPYPN
ncbi:hypothetical protein GC098_30110 [Paenibacillus sp. LMG 31458]|uniref:Uncharacterized protein n=1 Tax=Paenibacillus phytorum TaxID=2654977 RepID=A0ABX1Y485_9BACL|nr:hypothetical protein [Paenibacillus phytorum]